MDTTMAKRQRMIDMRESLADSLSTNIVKVFLLDNGSPQLVNGRAAIRRMSATHEEMTSAQVMRLINLLEQRIRTIDKELTSESGKATNLQTVTLSEATTSARNEPSNRESTGVSDRRVNEVARRLLVNGRLRSLTRSSSRMATPSIFRSETVDGGRFSVPLERNSQSGQRTTGTTRQSSSRRAVSSSRFSESRKGTNLQTVTLSGSNTSARNEPSNRESNDVPDRRVNEVSRRFLVNGRLRSPTRSSSRMAIPSTFRSETVDGGRFSVPLARNSQSGQRTTGTTRQSSSRRAVSSSRFSPSFEERLRHYQRSSRKTGRVSLDLRRNSSSQVRNGGGVRSSSDRTLQSRLNSAGRVGNEGETHASTANDRGQGSLLTDKDLKNRAPNTPFREFLTATGPSNPEQPEYIIPGTNATQEPVVRQDTITATSKAEVGGSIRNAKTKLTTNQTTIIHIEVAEPKLSQTTKSPNDIPVTLPTSFSKAVSPLKTTSQTLQKPTSTASARTHEVPSNTESHAMSIANEKKDIHTELPLQAIPQEEPTNPVLPVRVPVEQQTPTGGPLQVIPQEEPRNPLLLVPEQKPRTDTSLPSPAEPNTVVHSKEVKPSPSSVPGTKQTTMITTTKQSIKKQLETSHAKNIQGTDSSNKPTTSTNTANSLPTSEIPSTQQSLADQQASAQIPSPTKMALLSTIDTPNHTLSNSKPSPTSVPKERTTLQVELQKMIAKHREQETVRTGSATAHEEQMKLIKQLLSEIAGSPNNVPVMQVQTTTPIPVQQILQLIQAQEVNAALPVQVPRSTVQSTLFNDIIAMMQSNEAHTGNPTQSVRVNQLPHNQQQINFNGHPMMHQHTVIDPLEQQRIAMMSQMGNPMAGMYGGMMGYMNPEMMQEMMYGDTTDPPDPVQPPEQSNKKKEEQEGMTRPVPTTPVPTTTTVTVAQPLRHRTPLKLQPSHHALRDPDIRAYPPTRGPTTKSSWQEMDAAHFNTRHRYLPSNSEALSEVKQRQRPMQPPLSDAQIRKQHEHKYQILGTYETIKGPAMLESPSRPKEGFTPTTDPNMLLKIKASIERALKSAGIAKDVEIVLTDNNEEQTTSPTPLTGNTLLEKVKTSIENALQSAGISKNVKLVLKPKNKENRQMPVVTKAPVITTKSVIKPTKDSSWITQEGSQVTDMQTKPTTVNEALHGGMSFLSYSERPAKIPVDSSNHVYVQHNVRKRKHKETLNRHPLDSLMIGHITTVSPNYETPKSKDLPQNVELLGGFTPDIYQNEQGNRLTGGIDNIHKDTSSQAMIEGGWKVLSTDLHSSGTNSVINQVDKAETIQVKPDNFVPPPPRNKNRIFHRIPPHSRIPPKEPAKTTDVPQESTKPKLQSDRSDIVNKLIQALAASKHKGLLDSLSDVLLGKQSNHVGDGNTKQAHEASRRTWQGQRTTGIGSGITPSVKSQVHYTESKDATRHVPPPVLSLSQAPNKIHSTHNHIISAPLEPIKSNDKVFGSMNDMPHNRHESKVLSNVVRTPSEITMDSASTSPIQVPAQPDIASTQTKNTLATDQVIRQNIATKHITLNQYVVPSNSPRMIHTTNANTFSGANLFRRQTQDLPPHIDTQLHQTRIIQPKDALYQQEGPSVLEQTQAIKQGVSNVDLTSIYPKAKGVTIRTNTSAFTYVEPSPTTPEVTMRSALSFSLDVPSSKSDVLSSIPLIADSAIKIEKVVGDNISPQYPLKKAGSSEPTFPDYFRTIKPLEIPVTVTFPTTAGLKPSGPLLMNSRTMHTNEKADPKVPIQQHYEKSTTKSTVTLLPTTVKIVIDESTPYPQPSMVQDPTYYPYKEGYMHDHGTEKLYSVDNTDLFSNYNDVVHMPGKLLKRIRKSSDSEFSKSFWRPLSTRHRGHNQATGIPILMHLFSPTVSEPTVPEKKKVKPIEKTQHTGFKGLANRMEIKSKTRYQQKTRTLFDVSRHLQIAKDRNTPAPRVALKRKKDLPHPKTGSYTFPQRTLKIPTSKITPIKEEVSPKKTQLHSHLGIQHRRERPTILPHPKTSSYTFPQRTLKIPASKITPIKEEVSPKKTQLHSHLGIQHRRERPTVTLDRRPTQTFGTRGRQASQSHPEIFGRGEQSGPKISPRRDKILRSVLPPVDNRLFSQRISFQQHATGRHVVPMESPRRGTTRKQINLRQLPKGPNYHAAPAQQPPSTGLLQKQTNRSKENSVQKVAPKIYIPGSDRITNTRDRKSDLYSKKKPKVSSALQVKEKTTKTNYQLSNKMTSSPIDFKQLTLDILRTIRPDVHLNELIKDSTTTATTTIQNGHIITKSKKGNNDITHVETRISNVSHPQFIQTPLQTSPLTTPIVTTWKSRNLNTRDRKLELNSKKKPKVSSALQVPQITAKTTKTISNKDNLKAKTINKVSVKAFHQTVEKSLPNGIIIYSEKPAIFTKTTTIKERQTASTPATHSVKQRTEVPYTTMKETTVLQKTNDQLSNKITSSSIDFKQLTLDILRTIRPDVHLDELLKDSTTTATTDIRNGYIITKSKKGNKDITQVETRISNVSHPEFTQTPLQTSPLTTPIVTTWQSTTEITPMTTPQTTTEIITTPQTTTEIITTPQTTTQSITTPQTTTQSTTTPQTTTEIITTPQTTTQSITTPQTTTQSITTPQTTTEIITTPQTTTQSTTTPQTTTEIVKNPQPTIKVVTTPQTTTQVVTTPQTITVTTTKTPKSTTVFSTPQTTTPVITNPQTTTKVVTTPKLTTTTTTTSQVVTTQQVTKQVVTSPQTTLEVTTPPLIAVPVETILLSTTKATTTKNSPQALTSINSKMINPKTTPQVITSTEERRTPLVTTVKEAVPLSSTIHQLSPDFTTNRTSGHDTNEQGVYNSQMNSKSEVQLVRMTDPLTKTSFSKSPIFHQQDTRRISYISLPNPASSAMYKPVQPVASVIQTLSKKEIKSDRDIIRTYQSSLKPRLLLSPSLSRGVPSRKTNQPNVNGHQDRSRDSVLTQVNKRRNHPEDVSQSQLKKREQQSFRSNNQHIISNNTGQNSQQHQQQQRIQEQQLWKRRSKPQRNDQKPVLREFRFPVDTHSRTRIIRQHQTQHQTTTSRNQHQNVQPSRVGIPNLQQQQQIQQKHHQQQQVGTNPSQDKSSRNSQSSKYTNTAFITTTLPPVKQIKQFLQTFFESLDLHSTQSTEQHPNYTGLPQQRLNTQQLSMQSTRHSLPFSLQTRTVGPTHGSAVRPTSLHKQSQLQLPLQQNVHKKANFKRKRMESLSSSIKFAETNTNRALQQSPTVVTNKPQTTSRTRLRSMLPLFTKFHPSNLPSKNIIQVMPSRTTMLSTTTTDPPTTASSVSVKSLLMQLFKKEMRDSIKAIMPHQPTVTTERPTTTTVPITTTTSTSAPTTTTVKITTPASAESAAGQCGRGQTKKYHCEGRDMFYSMPSIVHWCIGMCFRGACIESVCSCNATCVLTPANSQEEALGSAISSALTGKSTDTGSIELALQSLLATLEFGTAASPTAASRFTSRPYTSTFAPTSSYISYEQFVSDRTTVSTTTKPTTTTVPSISGLLASIEKLIETKLRSMKPSTTKSPLLDAEGELIEAEDIPTTTTSTTVRHPPTQRRHPTSVPYSQLRYPNSHPSFQRRYPTSPPPTQRRYPTSPPSARHEQQSGWERRDQPAFHRRDHAPMWHDRGDQPKEHKDPWGRRSRPVERREWQDPWKDSPPRMTEPPPEQRWGEGGGVGRDGDGRGGDGRGGDGRGGGDQWGPREFIRRDGPPPRHLDTTPPPRAWQDNWRRDQGPRRDLGPPERGGWGGDRTTVDPLSQWGDRGFRRRRGRRFSRRSAFQGGEDAEPAD